jgi:hypothetical protein
MTRGGGKKPQNEVDSRKIFTVPSHVRASGMNDIPAMQQNTLSCSQINTSRSGAQAGTADRTNFNQKREIP